jgi:hypothetical protein
VAAAVSLAVAGTVYRRIATDIDRTHRSLAERSGEDSNAHHKSCFSDIVVDVGPEGRFSEWPSICRYYCGIDCKGGYQNEREQKEDPGDACPEEDKH